MSTYAGTIIQSSDDASQAHSNGNTTLTQIDVVFGTGFAQADTFGYRFQNVTIPANATINSATISIYVPTVSGAVAGSGTLDCILTPNVSTFSTGTNVISSQTRTGSTVTWSIVPPGSPGWITSPDISAAIQAVITQGSWSSGNALAVVLYGPTGGVTIELDFYDDSPSNAAQLNIGYTINGFLHYNGVPVSLNGLPIYI